MVACLNAAVPGDMVNVTVPLPLSLADTPLNVVVLALGLTALTEPGTNMVFSGNVSLIVTDWAFSGRSCTVSSQRSTPAALAVWPYPYWSQYWFTAFFSRLSTWWVWLAVAVLCFDSAVLYTVSAVTPSLTVDW